MKKKANLSLEEAFKKLDDIVDKIENKNLTIDEMIKLFEEGSQLTNICKKKIILAEDKIKDIIKKYEEE